jgi:8-oxo-dGTP pyrophosphatase MutT (NUDIX family)
MQSLTMKDVGELHVPDDAERIRNLQRLEITGAFQVHIPKPRFTAELTRLETFIFKPQTPSNEGDAFAYEIIRNMKREELKKVSVVCNTCRDFAMYRKRLGLDDKIFKLYLQGGEKFIWKARERKPSARRELKKLVGDEGYRTLITEDPRKAPIRYAMDTDINEATFNTKFDEHCHNPSHIQNYHESTSYPAIFRDVVRYMHGLSIEQKKSIFYYTSGKGSRMINELLLDRVEPHELQTFQIRHCNTLLKDVFSNIPPVREPFVVFRGYPSSTLDNGAFHSSTIRSDLFSGPDDWYTNFDRQSLAVKPLESENKSGCCHHIIRVMPGARVLYVEGTWAGISEYGEYEVLFAPCMGRFYHLRSFKDATNHIVCHDWVYVPEESPGASAGCGGTSESRKCRFRSRPENARILKSRFNKLKIALNVPHPAADSSCGMNGFIRVPSVPTIRATHKDPNQVATFVPGQKGLSYTSAKLTPSVMKTLMKLSKDAPVFHDGAAAGTIIFEPDGRLWIVHPTNKFVGYTSTFPKGTRDPGEDLRKTAIRETYEETGLLVSLKRYTGNCLDDTSGTREHNASNGAFAILKRDSGVTYYYLAKRESGSPADMGWESQAVSLVPVTSLGAQHVGRRYVSTSTWDVEPMEVIGEADKRSKDSMIVEFIESELLTIQEMLESDEW